MTDSQSIYKTFLWELYEPNHSQIREHNMIAHWYLLVIGYVVSSHARMPPFCPVLRAKMKCTYHFDGWDMRLILLSSSTQVYSLCHGEWSHICPKESLERIKWNSNFEYSIINSKKRILKQMNVVSTVNICNFSRS